jgi:starch-binding outer membrane protein, SusD/RagB family
MKKLHISQQKIGKLLLLPVFVMGLFFSSCEDEIINLEPFNQISETVAFSTPEKVALSVVGVY